MIQKRTTIDPQLYEADETAWLDSMYQLIEQGRFDELDYHHLGEYLADMANRDRRRVESRLTVLMEHLLKWVYQPDKRTRSWQRTILIQSEELLDDCESGVLRKHAEASLVKSYAKAVKRAAIATGLSVQTFPAECPYTLDQLLSSGMPGDQ
ncbi:MAG: DUF29 domain-containing protein [Pirellulales bacterium]